MEASHRSERYGRPVQVRHKGKHLWILREEEDRLIAAEPLVQQAPVHLLLPLSLEERQDGRLPDEQAALCHREVSLWPLNLFLPWSHHVSKKNSSEYTRTFLIGDVQGRSGRGHH